MHFSDSETTAKSVPATLFTIGIFTSRDSLVWGTYLRKTFQRVKRQLLNPRCTQRPRSLQISRNRLWIRDRRIQRRRKNLPLVEVGENQHETWPRWGILVHFTATVTFSLFCRIYNCIWLMVRNVSPLLSGCRSTCPLSNAEYYEFSGFHRRYFMFKKDNYLRHKR